MSDWTWEYVPDAAAVVGGLTPEQIVEVEALAMRLADAVGVRRIGTLFGLQGAVSGLKTYTLADLRKHRCWSAGRESPLVTVGAP